MVLTHSWKGGDFIPFPRGISPKVNVIPQLDFELIYYDVAVQHINHHLKGTAPHLKLKFGTRPKIENTQ